MESRVDGEMVLVIGVSRSGKSVFVRNLIRGKKRVFCFDPKNEYGSDDGFSTVFNRVELLAAVKSGADRISFVSLKKGDFDYWCRCAWVFNLIGAACIVAEELALNGASGAARGGWGRIVNQGLAYGMHIVGTVQRGQEVDKSLMNNATFLHISRHNTFDDRAYIAKKIGVDVDSIPSVPLRWLQWSSDKGVVCEGGIDFCNGCGVFKSGGKKLTVLGGGVRFSGRSYF